MNFQDEIKESVRVFSQFLEEEDDDEFYYGTPPGLVNIATEVTGNLLPKKSREHYDQTFKEFLKWRKESKATSFSERTLLAYFSELTQMWAYYSMIKSELRLNHDVDISKYAKLKSFLKRNSENYRPTKAEVFTEDEMKRFITDAPNEKWLAVKVVCIFGLCGAMRTEEFVNVCIGDVKQYDDLFHISVPETKTKTARSFTISGPFYDFVDKYFNLRPPGKLLTNRFFLRYENGKCLGNVIGKNKFSGMPRLIAEYLNLQNAERYTGHAFRRTSATILANTGASMERLKRHGAWKSSTVAEGYVEDSLAYKKKTGSLIVQSISDSSSSKECDSHFNKENVPTTTPLQSSGTVPDDKSIVNVTFNTNQNLQVPTTMPLEFWYY